MRACMSLPGVAQVNAHDEQLALHTAGRSASMDGAASGLPYGRCEECGMCVRAHECVGAWSVLPVACPVAGVRRVGCHCRGHKACLAHTAGVCVCLMLARSMCMCTVRMHL